MTKIVMPRGTWHEHKAGQSLAPGTRSASTLPNAPRSAPLYPARCEDLERITAAPFGQRRKMLRPGLPGSGSDGRHDGTMTPRILTDSDLTQVIDMASAIEAVEAAFRAKAAGSLVAPPRHHVAFPGHGDLVFTIGGTVGGDAVAGFRVYETFAGDSPYRSQVVAVWDARTGALHGLVLGDRLGELRTGAIGGVAIRYMASPEAQTVAVIGSGAQARTQLEAAAAVRRLKTVRVHSRSPENRRAFATEMADRLGLVITPVTTAREAVEGADIVLCATTSAVPVIDAAWLSRNAHINTIGPKTRTRHEIGPEIAERAAIIATDSPEQTCAYAEPFFLDGSPAIARMVDLAELVSGKVVARQGGAATTLFCSVGLAGTEVLVAAAALNSAR
jgi:ornithine cyclodeaminase